MISEDSDMLAYGCPRVLFKMDRNGDGQEICVGDLPQCRAPSFAGFTHEMFLEVGPCSACIHPHCEEWINVTHAQSALTESSVRSGVPHELDYWCSTPAHDVKSAWSVGINGRHIQAWHA